MATAGNITAEQRESFLENLAETRNVTVAARAAGIKRRDVLDLRARDADFALAWADAEEEASDLLEHEARQRAVKGVAEPVFYHGKQVGEVTRFSEELILLFLRAERPEKFGERPAGARAGTIAGRSAPAQFDGLADGPDGGVLVVPGKLDPATWSRQVQDYHRKLTNGDGGGG